MSTDPAKWDTVTGTDSLDGEYTIKLGNKNDGFVALAVDKDCKVFYIDDDGVITESTINSVRKTDDEVTYVVDSQTDEVIYLFIQQYFEDKDHSEGNTNSVVELNGTEFTYTYSGKAPSMLTVKKAIINYLADVEGYAWDNANGDVFNKGAGDVEYVATINGTNYDIQVVAR